MGAALVGAVIAVAEHYSETRDTVALLRHVRGRWLLAACACQAGTYIVQGEIFRAVDRASRRCIRAVTAWAISLAKLFFDQALPSAGVASSVAITNALMRYGMPRRAALAAVWLNVISYNVAYVIALAAAIALSAMFGRTDRFVIAVAALFMLFCMAMSVGILALAGRGRRGVPEGFHRWAALRHAAEFVGEADRKLTRSPDLLAETTALQLVIILFDTATLLALLRAIGVNDAAVSGVFVSFMISSLFRTMGFVPGGLGTFEASSVITLRSAGIDLSAALSATLLFRGLSFWIPMVPGLVASRRVMFPKSAAHGDDGPRPGRRRARALHPGADR